MTNFDVLTENNVIQNFLYDLRAIRSYSSIPRLFNCYYRYGFYYDKYYNIPTLLKLEARGYDINSSYDKNTETIRIELFVKNAIKWLLEDSVKQSAENKIKSKCHSPEGVAIKPDGINELDPCYYEEVETVYNVNVRVLRCKKCGHIELEWFRNED